MKSIEHWIPNRAGWHLALTQTFVALLETNSLAGALWIVDERRFRIRR